MVSLMCNFLLDCDMILYLENCSYSMQVLLLYTDTLDGTGDGATVFGGLITTLLYGLLSVLF